MSVFQNLSLSSLQLLQPGPHMVIMSIASTSRPIRRFRIRVAAIMVELVDPFAHPVLDERPRRSLYRRSVG